MSKITKLFVSPRTNAVFTRSQCASFSSEGLQIGHDPSSSEFHVELDSQKAFLKYSRKGNVIELEHTEVPEVKFQTNLRKAIDDFKSKILLDFSRKRSWKAAC